MIVTFENARLSSFSLSSVSPASVETMSNTFVSTSSHELRALKPSFVSDTLILTLTVSPTFASYVPASILRADSAPAIFVFDSGCSDELAVFVGTAVGADVGAGVAVSVTSPTVILPATAANLSPVSLT